MNSWMPSKVKIFGWRLLKDKLATRVQLVKRCILGNSDKSLCAFSCMQVEDSHHLFLNCELLRGVCEKILAWIGIEPLVGSNCCNQFTDMVKIMRKHCSPRRAAVIWLGICRCIWKQRNIIIFYNGVGDTEEIVHNAKMFSWWWLVIGNKHKVSCNFYEWNHNPLDFM